MTKHATIDFETRSEVDLKKTGSWRYAEDESTEALVLCHAIGMGDVQDWINPDLSAEFDLPKTPDPEDLFYHIQQGGLVEAHNAFFERSIWRNVMVPRYNWPDIPDHQWRCSAAKAAAHSLPRALGNACEVMGVSEQKDKDGHALMLKLCKPRSAWLKNGTGPKYAGDRDDHLRNLEYCRQDVRAERALGMSLADLPETEWKVWMIDQTINERGIHCDKEMVKHVIALIEQYRKEQRAELVRLTNGRVERETKRKDVLQWFIDNEVPIENTQAATLRDVAEEYEGETIGAVANLCASLNKSSVSKYKAMLARASESDDRIRDTLMYHGAGTGRWSGRGVQFQNLARGSIKDMEKAVDDIMGMNLRHLMATTDDPMPLFSGLVRGAISAPHGRILRVADYSSIEARGAMWLAGATDAMQIFHRGEDIYCDLASDIYGHPVDKSMPDKRQLGKQGILGLGYSMGPAKFLQTCEGYNIHFTDEMMKNIVPPEDRDRIRDMIHESPAIYFPGRKKVQKSRVNPLILSKFVVERYRSKYSDVVQYWYDCEEAATLAVLDHMRHMSNPDAHRPWRRAGAKRPGNVFFKVHGKFLFCRLPAKRFIAYPFPSIREVKTPWGDKKESVTYMGVDSFTRKWVRQKTYGGKLVENITQGVARDIMADAMIRVEGHEDYDIVMSVHDELITETEGYCGSTEELEQLMAQLPVWAEGFPLAAEGWSGQRYRK